MGYRDLFHEIAVIRIFQPAMYAIVLAGLPAACVLSIGAERPVAPPPKTKRLTAEQVDRLISQLGSEDFEQREEATAALKRRPEAAVAILRASRRAKNPETARRAQSILPFLMSREGANQRLDQLPSYLANGQIDKFIETFIACREFAGHKHLNVLQKLIDNFYKQLIGKEDLLRMPWLAPRPEGVAGLKKDVSEHHPQDLTYNVNDKSWINHNSIIIDSHGISRGVVLPSSLVISNGDIRTFAIYSCFVITTGDVELIGGIDESVLICAGEANVESGSASVIVSRGAIRAYGDDLGWHDRKTSLIRGHDRQYFRNWNLFSGRDVGASYRSIFGLVQVRDLRQDSVLAQSGVGVEDFILEVDGIPVKSPRGLNRLLCRAAVSWGSADLTIVSQGAIREVCVKLSQW